MRTAREFVEKLAGDTFTTSRGFVDALTAAIEARDAYWKDQIAAITAEDAARAPLWDRLDGIARGLLDSNERIETTSLRAERDTALQALEVAREALGRIGGADASLPRADMQADARIAFDRVNALYTPRETSNAKR